MTYVPKVGDAVAIVGRRGARGPYTVVSIPGRSYLTVDNAAGDTRDFSTTTLHELGRPSISSDRIEPWDAKHASDIARRAAVTGYRGAFAAAAACEGDITRLPSERLQSVAGFLRDLVIEVTS